MGIAVVYAAYLAVSIGLTVIVASALSRSGRVYLAEVFGGDLGLAAAVNRMLVVGFCLLSLGYAALTMRTSGDIHGPGEALGVLSVKVGEELLVLGALHLVHMMFLSRLRRRQETGGRPGGPGIGGRPGGRSIGGRPGGRPGADWPPTAPGAARATAAQWPGAAVTGRSGTGTVSGQGGLADLGSPGATDPASPAPARAVWPGATEPASPAPDRTAWPAAATAAEVLH